MEEQCFICGEGNENVLERHHLIPRRYGGEDVSSNMVTLCANCHRAIERLYDDRFFLDLGVERTDPSEQGDIPDGTPLSKINDGAGVSQRVEAVVGEIEDQLIVSEERKDLLEGAKVGWLDRGNSSGRAEVPPGTDVIWVRSAFVQEAVSELGYDENVLSSLSKEFKAGDVTFDSTTTIRASMNGTRKQFRCYPFARDHLSVENRARI